MLKRPRQHDEKHLKFVRQLPCVLTAERLRDLLSYNAETGDFHWRETRGGIAAKGSSAGWIAAHGYRVISVELKKYYAHRLAWLYVYGDWPSKFIDHINGDPLDNRISNLREGSQSQNMQNRARLAHNKSGFKGVSWSNRDRCWRSFITIEKKRVSLGSFKSPEEAYAVYCEAAKKHYGEWWRPE